MTVRSASVFSPAMHGVARKASKTSLTKSALALETVSLAPTVFYITITSPSSPWWYYTQLELEGGKRPLVADRAVQSPAPNKFAYFCVYVSSSTSC
jgi:hypothetical protein